MNSSGYGIFKGMNSWTSHSEKHLLYHSDRARMFGFFGLIDFEQPICDIHRGQGYTASHRGLSNITKRACFTSKVPVMEVH